MNKIVKGFVLGFTAASLTIAPLTVFADTIQVALNAVNINLNGAQIVIKGESYVHVNGTILPYSLNYKGTVYLPIRKVSEIMGKDIGYDAKSSTVSISDKYPVPVPATPSAVIPNNNTSSNAGKDKDDTDVSRTETGYGVINSFADTKSNNKWVNRAKGLMNGDPFSMLTSKADLIDFTATAPCVYELSYRDDIISDIDTISVNKEDMLKANAGAGELCGYKDNYDLSSRVVVYRMERDENGTFKEYSVSDISSLRAGDKVYLYDIGEKSGYDIVIEEDSWI